MTLRQPLLNCHKHTPRPYSGTVCSGACHYLWSISHIACCFFVESYALYATVQKTRQRLVKVEEVNVMCLPSKHGHAASQKKEILPFFLQNRRAYLAAESNKLITNSNG